MLQGQRVLFLDDAECAQSWPPSSCGAPESSLFKMVDTVQVPGRRSSGDEKKMCQSLRIFDQITDVDSTVQDEATLVDGLLAFMVDDLLIPEFGLCTVDFQHHLVAKSNCQTDAMYSNKLPSVARSWHHLNFRPSFLPPDQFKLTKSRSKGIPSTGTPQNSQSLETHRNSKCGTPKGRCS